MLFKGSPKVLKKLIPLIGEDTALAWSKKGWKGQSEWPSDDWQTRLAAIDAAFRRGDFRGPDGKSLSRQITKILVYSSISFDIWDHIEESEHNNFPTPKLREFFYNVVSCFPKEKMVNIEELL